MLWSLLGIVLYYYLFDEFMHVDHDQDQNHNFTQSTSKI
jgi:hypothetical protein